MDRKFLKSVCSLLDEMPEPFSSSTLLQRTRYASKLLELKLLYAVEAAENAIAKDNLVSRKNILRELAGIQRGLERVQKFKRSTPATNIAEKEIVSSVEAWAKRNGSNLPIGFSPSRVGDGSIDYGSTDFVRNFFDMARVMAHIIPVAKERIQKKSYSPAKARKELTGVLLPHIIEEVFGQKLVVYSGSAQNAANLHPTEILKDRPAYKLIEGSLRLIDLWEPRVGSEWHPELLAKDAKDTRKQRR